VAKFRIEPGREFDVVSTSEMTAALDAHKRDMLHALVREQLRGIKYMRIAGRGPASQTQIIDCGGPRAGYLWSVRRVSISSTFNGTADLYRSTDAITAPPALRGFVEEITIPASTFLADWKFSSNSCIVLPDEHLVVTSNQSNLGACIVNGDAVEVPEEMAGKLFT